MSAATAHRQAPVAAEPDPLFKPAQEAAPEKLMVARPFMPPS